MLTTNQLSELRRLDAEGTGRARCKFRDKLERVAPDLLRAAEVLAACERWGVGAVRDPDLICRDSEYQRGYKAGYDRAEAESHDEIERFRAIVDRLPKTADGVPVVPGMTLWARLRGRWVEVAVAQVALCGVLSTAHHGYISAKNTFSTREAAEAAKEER